MKRYLGIILLCAATFFVVKGAHAQNPNTVTINNQTWTKCADDPQTCSFTGSSQVVYGAFPPNDPTAQYDINGPFTNGISCFIGQVDSNDPAPGYGKSCYLPPSGPPAPTVTLTANPTTITSGQSSTLTLSTTNATSCTGPVSGTSGTTTVSPTATTTYTETCTGAGGSGSGSTTVTVQSNPPPTVTLTANPTTINSGQSSTLTLSTANATSCTGPVSGTLGTATVSPTSTTTYTETCTGSGGSASGSATVTVNSGGCTASTPTQGVGGSLVSASVTTSDGTRVFPNGASVAIVFNTNATTSDTVMWSIADYKGNVVRNGTFGVASGSVKTTLTCPMTTAGSFAVSGTLTGEGGSLPAIGTEPANMVAFGVLPSTGILPLPTYASPDQHRIGIQGFNDAPAHLAAVGAVWTLDGHDQATWEPSGPNTYSPTVNDHDPFYTNNTYIHRVIRLDGIPGWDSSTGMYNDSYSLPTNLSEYGSFIGKVGTSENLIHNALYPNDRKNYYQVTWEPSLGWPQSQSSTFLQLYQTVFSNLHANDSHAFVMGPAEPFPNNNGNATGNRITATAGLCAQLDGVATHGYFNAPTTPDNPPELQNQISGAQANSLNNEMHDLRATMQACKPNMALWQTELGISYNSNTPYGSALITQNQLYAQGVIAARSHIIILGEGAQVTFYFFGPDPSDANPAGYGLFYSLQHAAGGDGDRDVAPKPQGMTLAALSRILDGTTTLGKLNNLPATVYGYAFQQMGTGGKTITAMWMHDNNVWPSGGPYSQTASICYLLSVDAPGTSGNVTILDVMGNAHQKPYTNGQVNLLLTESPIYIITPNASALSYTPPVGYTGQ